MVVDDHDLVREGLRSLLAQFDDIELVGEAATAEAALEVVGQANPDLVLLDLRLGEQSGVDVARELRARGSRAKILVLSVHDTSQHLREALAAGADGYLLKSVSGQRLADGIRQAVSGVTVIGEEFVPKLVEEFRRGTPGGAPQLTGREREVLDLVAEGLTNREVGERLGMSVRTAQKHVENLFKKFAVHDRAELVAVAFRRGVLG